MYIKQLQTHVSKEEEKRQEISLNGRKKDINVSLLSQFLIRIWLDKKNEKETLFVRHG